MGPVVKVATQQHAMQYAFPWHKFEWRLRQAHKEKRMRRAQKEKLAYSCNAEADNPTVPEPFPADGIVPARVDIDVPEATDWM